MTRRIATLLALALLAYLHYALLLHFALLLDATLLLVWWLRGWTARRLKYHTLRRLDT